MSEIFDTILEMNLIELIWPYLPTIIFFTIVIIGAIFTQKIIIKYVKKIESEYGSKYGIQFNTIIIKIIIYLITFFVLLVNLPGISKDAINVISLVFGAIIAFSSSSIIANAMGGIMILLMRPFRIGDIVRLSDVFGEVAEIRLIYTIIETEKRELVTIPNGKLINDVLVNFSKDQHIISSVVRIEYKIDRYTVEKHLLRAALDVNLIKPFVLITDLKPHYIGYEVRGILKNVGEIITIRSDLHKAIIDKFDAAKIQIMSPERMRVAIVKTKESDIPNVKVKQISKNYIEKEAFRQEKTMFGRAEKIKDEIKKEMRIKKQLKEEESIKNPPERKKEQLKRLIEREQKTISILRTEEQKLKELEDI